MSGLRLWFPLPDFLDGVEVGRCRSNGYQRWKWEFGEARPGDSQVPWRGQPAGVAGDGEVLLGIAQEGGGVFRGVPTVIRRRLGAMPGQEDAPLQLKGFPQLSGGPGIKVSAGRDSLLGCAPCAPRFTPAPLILPRMVTFG